MLQEREPAELEAQCAQASSTAAALNTATDRWHQQPATANSSLFNLHLANFQLWHLEDEARDVSGGDSAVAHTKRSIDTVNQRRNDTVEAIDAALLQALHARGLPFERAPLHSETPGQMLDRLSILSLKLFHTALEAERENALPAHREASRLRLRLLQEQQDDLAHCLSDLWQAVLDGTRRFKQYRQLKMYNDPALNPVLYSAREERKHSGIRQRSATSVP